jgi:hypothetical protein
MPTPNIYTTEQIKKWDASSRITRQGREYWTPARPYSNHNLRLWHRLKLTWLVFTGECDVLRWIEK